jgi:hypothetical protein
VVELDRSELFFSRSGDRLWLHRICYVSPFSSGREVAGECTHSLVSTLAAGPIAATVAAQPLPGMPGFDSAATYGSVEPGRRIRSKPRSAFATSYAEGTSTGST